ncbi:Aminotransferase class-V [Fragilaria crotonensis]|nr:Aminotransferase class-V [Fragilaria crotonensis]
MVETAMDFHEIDPGICYLDHAKEALLSPCVKLAGWKAIRTPPWECSSAGDKAEIRTRFAALIGASPDDIAIMASTAFAISLAAVNIANVRKDGGKIVLLQDEMCSEVYPWQKLVNDNPAFQLDVVDSSPDNFSNDVLNRLDKTVAVVAIPHLHWSHGALLDLDAISNKCDELDIDLILDGTQSIGIMSMNVTRLNPTMVACSIQKWLRAPPGMSLVYVNPRIRNSWQPLDQHGRGRDFGKTDWNAYPNEMGPHGYPEKFFPDARKFDSGGNMTQVLLSMLRASLEEVFALDTVDAQTKLKTLMHPLLDWAKRKEVFVPKNHAYHLVGLRPNNIMVEQMIDVCHRLESDGVFISVRNGYFRISPYVMNTTDDIQRLIDGFNKYLFI